MAIFTYKDIDIYYELKGNLDSDLTVGFFNGVMASTSSWSYLVPIFEKLGYKIILHDFKGQLKSDKPVGPYTFASHCEEAHALFEHLNINKIHLIGTSYGGEIAMKFAMLYPEITSSISIIDSVSELDPVIEYFLKGWKNLCNEKDGEAFFWGMAPSIYGPDFLKNNHEMLVERSKAFSKINPDYFDGQKILYDTFLSEVTMTDQLHLIKCPALVVCGDEDLLKRPKFSKIIADGIKNSEYIILPNCGHVAIFEKPNELQSVLLGFVLKHS